VHLASKCVCCDNGSVESINHLFILGDMARLVWGFFGNVLHINTNFYTIYNMLNCWMHSSNNSSQIGCITRLLGVAIPWSIWLFRNNHRFGNSTQDKYSIFRNIYHIIHKANVTIKSSKDPSYEDKLILDILGICPTPRHVKFGKWCKWSPPNRSKLKLNIDGACFNNSCFGGGIIRNEKGCMVLAFSFPISDGSPLHSELGAAIHAINLCLENNIRVDTMEMDSALLYNYLNNPSKCPWLFHYTIKKCLMLLNNLNPQISLSHVYRECNTTADALAKSRINCVYLNQNDLPNACRNNFIADMQGMHHYRPP